jgi:hypothetical protein
LKAEGIFFVGVGAGNYGFEVHNTLEGQSPGVTNKGTVALVAVFLLAAVGILEAVTVNGSATAFPFTTLVGQGARIAVIARSGCRRILAAPSLGAHVIGA